MKTTKIRLTSIEAVRDFVEVVRQFDGDIDLSSGRYVVDAKSIMGIFSLDLSKPIKVEIFADECEQLLKELEQFMV